MGGFLYTPPPLLEGASIAGESLARLDFHGPSCSHVDAPPRRAARQEERSLQWLV
jgi:hypothetical protein